MSGLRDRWVSLFDKVGAKGDPSKYFALLEKQYSEPSRYYHNLSHIEHCLNECDDVKSLLSKPGELEMAIWFHDSIYNINSKENERESADLAVKSINEMSLPQTFANRVNDMIMVTLHNFVPKSSDGKFMVDIDLSSFGQAKAQYERDENNVMKEYGSVPDSILIPGRLEFLRRFLGRPSIFYTDYFRDKYEEAARKNIERSIANFQSVLKSDNDLNKNKRKISL